MDAKETRKLLEEYTNWLKLASYLPQEKPFFEYVDKYMNIAGISTQPKRPLTVDDALFLSTGINKLLAWKLISEAEAKERRNEIRKGLGYNTPLPED